MHCFNKIIVIIIIHVYNVYIYASNARYEGEASTGAEQRAPATSQPDSDALWSAP